MVLWKRLALAALVVAVDLLLFVVPLAAIAAAYVILARPPWFLHWVLALYDSGGARPDPAGT